MSAPPFAIRYRPTRGEYLHGLATWAPWGLTLQVIVLLVCVRFIDQALREPSAMHIVRVALVALAAVALELSYRGIGAAGVELRFDAAGLHASWAGQDRRIAWPSVRLREATDAYVFVGRLGAGHVLPRRVLDAPAIAAVEAWLEEQRVPRGRRAGWLLDRVVLVFVLLLSFVTVYNLLQRGAPAQTPVVAAPTAADVPAAALTMLLRDAGARVTLETVRAEAGDRSAPTDLVLVAQRLGVRLWATRADGLPALRRLPRPFLAGTRTAGIYLLVERIDDSVVRYVDPVLGKRVQAPTPAFLRAMSGLVLCDHAPL